MNASGVRTYRKAGLLVALTLLLLACQGTDAKLPTAREAPPSPGGAILARAAANARTRSPVSLQEFRERNPMSFVGKAHNAGLTAFFRSLTGENKRRPCAAAEVAFRAARRAVGSDSGRLGSEESFLSTFHPAATFRCPPASIERNTTSSAAPASGAASSLSSGDPQPYLDAMEDLVDLEPAAETFISQMDAIAEDAAGVLSGPELEIVQATASVTVESHDYWLTQNNLPAVGDSVVNAYPECHHQMNPEACVYEQASPSFRTAPLLRLVSSRGRGCYEDTMSPWRVLGADLAGAIAGAVVGAAGGPGAAAPAAAGGALGGSIYEALVQAMDYLTCRLAQ